MAATSTTTTAVAVPSESLVPLTILLRSDIDAVSDFFPFHDLAGLDASSNDEFSFQSLIEDIGGNQEIMLFARGCLVDGNPDCHRACNDTSIFFSSLETFYNCAALAAISYWTQDSMVYFIDEEAERNASSIMGAGNLAGFDDRPVLNSFISCSQEACRKDGLAKPCSQEIEHLSVNSSSAKEVFDAMKDFCPGIAAEINPDIFGPGVLISYVLQVSFTALLYLFVKGFSIWVKLGEEGAKRRRPQRLRRIETMIWRDESAYSRTSVAIAGTLVEFQEAQCWFVFAVQIASILAIVVNSQEGTFWGELVINGAIAYHVSLNGVLPMFLIQICLHNEGIRNWHTFLGFLLEYVLAIVAATQKIRFHDAFELFMEQGSIDSCGGNPSPRTYCAVLQTGENMGFSFFPDPLLYKYAFLVLDTIAVVVLVTDQLMWTLRKHRRTKHWTKESSIGTYRAGRGPQGSLKPYWLKFKFWSWQILEAVYLVINILYMISLIQVINRDTFATNRWSYGQIIAVTVWGPVIVKLFDLLLSGPQTNGGMKMNSGPPRLRIDNVINRRLGSMEEDDDYGPRKTIPGPPPDADRPPSATGVVAAQDFETRPPQAQFPRSDSGGLLTDDNEKKHQEQV